MRLLRALSAALILVSSSTLVLGEPEAARGQDVTDAEEDADSAREEAQEAASLLSEVASRRSGLENELADSLTRLHELGAELSRVSVHLDDLRLSLARADEDLTTIASDLRVQVVDAYVRAVTVSAASVVGTGNAESAMVAATSLESAIGSDHAEVASLTIKRRELRELEEQYTRERERVEELQSEVDAEAAHLEELLAEADADLAAATAEARNADRRHREALDAVALARAREEERQRQSGRTTTTTTPPTSTTTPPTTSSPADAESTSAPSTTSPPPVEGGPFAPAVERWRGTVASHFPAGRVDEALAVIGCESNGDPRAYNPYSGASGLFQFLPATWATVSPRAGYGEASVFDGEANIATAAWLSDYYAGRGSGPWAPWTCRP